jgi:WD40 repeat protein
MPATLQTRENAEGFRNFPQKTKRNVSSITGLRTSADKSLMQPTEDPGFTTPEFEFQQLLSYDFTDLAGQDFYTQGLVLTGRGAETYLSIGKLIYRFTEDATESPVQLSDKGGAYDIDITSDGRNVAIARARGRVEIWNTEPWEMKHRLVFTDISGNATMVEISPDGQWVGAVMMRGRAAIWELESGRLVTEIPIESDEPWTLRPAFSADSRKMVVLGQNGNGRKIYEIDVKSGDSEIKLCEAVSGHGDIVIGGHARAVIASHPNGPLYLVDSRTWQDARIIGTGGDEKALAWAPDSTLLASANPKDQGLALYDGPNCQWLKNIALDGLVIENVAFSKDSRTLAVSGLVTRSDVEGPVPAIRVWRLSEKSGEGQPPESNTSADRFDIRIDRLPMNEAVKAANLVVNGSFEVFSPAEATGNRVFDDSPMGKWNVTGSVDVSGGWQAHHGTKSLDMNGTAKGAIAQTIRTVPGQNYRLSFAVATNIFISKPCHLRVSWNDEELVTLTLEKEGRTSTDMKWRLHDFNVEAKGPESLLKFESLDEDTGVGPVLDSVSLVPESDSVD